MSLRWEIFIREAGRAVDEAMPADDPWQAYARHLAAHSVAEEQVTGTCTKTLSMTAPCPYCGKLPPGMAFPGSVPETVA